MTWFRSSLSGFLVVLLALWSYASNADMWELPSDKAYQSANGQYQFFVAVGTSSRKSQPTGILSQKSGEGWEGIWTNVLVNRISPVNVMVPDTGRYVVTFDEWHSIGKNPVVVYGHDGRLIAHLTLADLQLELHSRISRSVSSYDWNESAIIVFGPTAATTSEPWRRTLQDSLFIRLYWGDVIAIDLASGKVRDPDWEGNYLWETMEPEDAAAMEAATQAYLEETWRRLAREYMRKENFDPNPNAAGIRGMLLVGQLRLRESLPLLEEAAATERFESWHAPRLKPGQDCNVRDLARAVIAEIE